MSSCRSQTGTPVNLYKKLKEEQRDELCRLHQNYRTRIHNLSAEYKAKYKKLLTQEERAVLLATFVQIRSQAKQAYTYAYEQLVIQQSRQRETPCIDSACFVELHKRGRIKAARIVIKAAMKSGTL